MGQFDTLIVIIVGLAAYSALFLSRNKYVTIIVALLASSGAVFAVIVVAMMAVTAAFVSFFFFIVSGHGVFGSMMSGFLAPYRITALKLIACLIAATPFLFVLRTRPHLTWQTLATAAAFIFAYVAMSHFNRMPEF